MFTPPHEFAINIPQILSEARMESYKEWSWPSLLARAFKEPRIALLLADIVISGRSLWRSCGLVRAVCLPAHTGPGAFYAIVPYLAMVIPALALFFFGIAIWLRGAVRSWSETNGTSQPALKLSGKALLEAIGAALGLRHLEGGGPGCTYPEERPSSARRIHHSFVFWGFLADFVSTSLAFIYQDFLHQLPPYPLTSAPVIFGSVGGVLLIIGTAGLIGMKRKSDRAPAVERAYGMDYAFLIIARARGAHGHAHADFSSHGGAGQPARAALGAGRSFFITAPYGKFVHAVYRSLALVRYYAEQGQLIALGRLKWLSFEKSPLPSRPI